MDAIVDPSAVVGDWGVANEGFGWSRFFGERLGWDHLPDDDDSFADIRDVNPSAREAWMRRLEVSTLWWAVLLVRSPLRRASWVTGIRGERQRREKAALNTFWGGTITFVRTLWQIWQNFLGWVRPLSLVRFPNSLYTRGSGNLTSSTHLDPHPLLGQERAFFWNPLQTFLKIRVNKNCNSVKSHASPLELYKYVNVIWWLKIYYIIIIMSCFLVNLNCLVNPLNGIGFFQSLHWGREQGRGCCG